MSRTIKVALLVIAIAFVGLPAIETEGQVGPCWECRKLDFPPDVGGGWQAICLDFDDGGKEFCIEVFDNTACLRWGNTCQHGV